MNAIFTYSLIIFLSISTIVNAQSNPCNKLGVWLWFIEGTIFDSHEALADSLANLGVDRIYVKVADGSVNIGVWPEIADEQLVQTYLSAGLEVWSWSYNYPGNPIAQAEALTRAAQTGYQGHVVDVEMEFDGDSSQLADLFSAFQNAQSDAIANQWAGPNFELRCTTWGNPIDHQYRIDVIDQYVDAHMPQTYVEVWGQSFIDNAAFWIQTGNEEYQSLGATKPIHHITTTQLGLMTADDIRTFMDASGNETSIWRVPGGGVPASIWDTWKEVNWEKSFCQGEGYTTWTVGDTMDVTPSAFQPGVVVAGGGTDNDDAMKWMLSRAAGGDVVVIRASGSDGYNDYFYQELGVNVNSVQTIRFDDLPASYDQYVIDQIRDAELIWIAGGDQHRYFELWKGTPIEDAIHYAVNEKGVTIGGTSAGMAILGEHYYTPDDLGAISDEALSNPFHPYLNILGSGDFLEIPIMSNIITDTHFDQRSRDGRTMTFLSRLAKNQSKPVFGIACNEVTAVCIDENGIAHVFGEHPEYDDYAYFFHTNCSDIMPEVCKENTPLTWNAGEQAVSVYRLPGTVEGTNTFDLNTFQSGNGGTWGYWFVENGSLEKNWMGESPDCQPVGVKDISDRQLDWDFVYHRQANQMNFHFSELLPTHIDLLSIHGQLIRRYAISDRHGVIALNMPTGIYMLTPHGKQVFRAKKLLVN